MCAVRYDPWGNTNPGEPLGVERRHVDLEARTISVKIQAVRLRSGEILLISTKTKNGRVVPLPDPAVAALETHLKQYVETEPAPIVFTGPRSSGRLRRATLYAAWNRVKAALGDDHFTVHDLRRNVGVVVGRNAS